MKCRTCHCELDKKNQPVATLDFALEEGEELMYYCSAECLVKWIMEFAIVHYLERGNGTK